jgi:hypothetical protein
MLTELLRLQNLVLIFLIIFIGAASVYIFMSMVHVNIENPLMTRDVWDNLAYASMGFVGLGLLGMLYYMYKSD